MARRLLIVSTAFHGIWRSVADAFEQLGWDVSTHLYDDYASMRAKARNKLEHELPSRLGVSTLDRRRAQTGRVAGQAVREQAPDAVLVIKGDVLGGAFWDALDERRLPRATWLYDQLDAMHYTPADQTRLGGIATFSASDTQILVDRGLVARHVHLAFDPSFDPSGDRVPGVVFVGARYPSREQLLLQLQSAGVPLRAYGRSWSHHPVDRLRTWELSRPPIPGGRELARDDAHRIMEAADATVNVHGSQDGYTLRTFEASGIGAVHLIDRPDVDELYEPGKEILVYGGPDALVDLARRAAVDREWADRVRRNGRARTLAAHTFVHRARLIEGLLLPPS